MGKVILVDASLLDRKRMRSVLEAAGHAVMEMSSPTQAMDEIPNLSRGAVSLILTELEFPDVSGLALVRWVKQQEALRDVPVLVVTAQPPRNILIELVTAGASTIVTKPFGGDMLLRRVTETLAEQAILRQGVGESLSWPIDDYLRRELKRAERSGTSLSVVVCRVVEDLDGQALPHLIGGLAHIMRESDVLTRLGDQEVVMFLPDTDWAGATTVEARVRAVAQGLSGDDAGRLLIPLQIATGAATYPSEAADGESLVAVARERMA